MNLETRASITNVNPRGELHGEERELACDVNLTAEVPLSKIVGLLHEAGIDADDFQKMYWSADNNPVPKTTVKQVDGAA